MLKSKALLTGKLTATVFGPDGEIKRFAPRWWEKFLGLPGRKMQVTNHNIVTNEGDALFADLMQETPEQNKVDNTNGYIEVGTGFTTESKTTLSCVTPTGAPEVMDATYPKTKGDWGAADDGVIQYRSTYEAGELNQVGIDEAALLNASTAVAADCLAYAEITPAVDVGSSDTLQVDWELTVLGS